MQTNKKMSPGGNLVTRALDYHQQTERDNNHMIARTTTKRKTFQHCNLSPEARATQLLKEFKRDARQRGLCECARCLRHKSLPSMRIAQVLYVDGRPVGCYAICRRCWLAALRDRIEPAEIVRMVEASLTVDYLEVWG